MIDLFFHWLAPESTPTGRRYWLRWASVLVTAAVPRGPTRAGARAREGPSGEGGGGPARGPGKVGGARPVGERLSPGPPCALWRAAERGLLGLRAEEGRGAVHSRDIRGSGAKGRRGGCVGGVGPSPQSGGDLVAPCSPPWSAPVAGRWGSTWARCAGPVERGQRRGEVGPVGRGGERRAGQGGRGPCLAAACCGDRAGPAPVALRLWPQERTELRGDEGSAQASGQPRTSTPGWTNVFTRP